VDGKSTHIPYRDSKLTRLLQGNSSSLTSRKNLACSNSSTVLQFIDIRVFVIISDSLGGNAKTVMVANMVS
jgi:hypothetical protein